MQRVLLDPAVPLPWPRTALAIGNFDGVHRGHQALVAAAVLDARANGGTAAVLTFDPHPGRVLRPEAAPAALNTLDQKEELLGALGVQRLAVLPFSREIAALEPAEFGRAILQASLGARLVVVGSNFRFGRRRAGDVDTLRQLGRTLGWEVHDMPPLLDDGLPISSTRIREALARGAVEEAARLLGREHFVDGPIVEGDRRGRTLGFPTANLQPVNEVLPANGVYAVELGTPDGTTRWPAVANLGRRPTFGGTAVTLESHVLGDPGDLYGRRLRLAFVTRLREERPFPGKEALLDQIRRDVEQARAVLAPRFGL